MMKTNPCPIFFCALFFASALFSAEPQKLTLQQAEQLALTRHPRISAAELQALAANQAVVEARAAFFPHLGADISAVGGSDPTNTRIAAGSLGAAHVFNRASGGLTASQLITDFGRTANLTASAKLRSLAEKENAQATRAEILLQVDSAFFATLRARSLQNVARQTLKTRELIAQQVRTLAENQLKSDLDVSFAEVSLEEGVLLAAKAENDWRAANATLSALLGFREARTFDPAEEPMPAAPVGDIGALIGQAIQSRPELARLRFEHDAAMRFAKAERALNFPTISAVGAIGETPVRADALLEKYAAGGLFFSVPIFQGGLYLARQHEAEFRARAIGENLRDSENNVIRDVRLAWLNAQYASQHLALTEKLLEHANRAFELAQGRYQVGAASIVELSQAQLEKTSAEIQRADAKYDYLTQRAILKFQTGALR